LNAGERNLDSIGLRSVITFDIDSRECYEFISELIEVNKSLVPKYTINFLTKGNYRVESALLEKIASNECEIGLHGDTHDLLFCTKSRSEISRRLDQMIKSFPAEFRPTSYRHPGFGTSKKLFQELSNRGFTCDSSVKAQPYFGDKLILPIPVTIDETNIAVLPTVLSDDSLIREDKVKTEEIQDILRGIINFVKVHDGVLTLNFHPSIVRNNLSIYEKMFEQINAISDVKYMTMREIA
jgi:hypothetical protein